jgi:oligoendopeptidase F
MLELHNIKSSAFEKEDSEEFENRFKEFIAAVEENFGEQEQSVGEKNEKLNEYKALVIHELQKVLETIYGYLKSLRQDHTKTFGNFFELIVTNLLPKDFENSRYFNFFSGNPETNFNP